MVVASINKRPNPTAIDVLIKALEKARSGEIQAVCIAWVEDDLSINSKYSSGTNQIMTWASLELAAKQFYEKEVNK